MYFKQTFNLLLIVLAALAFSCGPKPAEIDEHIDVSPAPEISGLQVLAINGKTTLQWSSSRKAGEAFGGYDIFVVHANLESDVHPKPLNATPYPGDTDGNPSSESFETTEVESGKVYKAWVAAYSSNGESISTTDTVQFSPMYAGRIVLSQRFSDNGSGYDFSRRKSAPARSPNGDIMFFAGNGKPKLSAPERLNSKFAATRFVDLGRDISFDSFTEYSPNEFSGASSVPLKAGHLYLVRTSNGRFVKLHCISITGQGGRQKAEFRFVYNPIRNYYGFR